jgi:hypothetical protein
MTVNVLVECLPVAKENNIAHDFAQTEADIGADFIHRPIELRRNKSARKLTTNVARCDDDAKKKKQLVSGHYQKLERNHIARLDDSLNTKVVTSTITFGQRMNVLKSKEQHEFATHASRTGRRRRTKPCSSILPSSSVKV